MNSLNEVRGLAPSFSCRLRSSITNKDKVSIAHTKAKRIITLNLKGGVGKSTFTAGLLSQLVEKGHKVELIDFDQQESSYNWASSVPEIECQTYNPALKSFSEMASTLKVSTSSDYVVIDSPANFSERELFRYLKYADYIVIPMQPSPIDLHSSLPLINNLIDQHLYKGREIKVGFVLNRVYQGDERLVNVQKLLKNFRQFQSLGIMSESAHYQEAFYYKKLIKSSNKDADLWQSTLNWMGANERNKQTELTASSMVDNEQVRQKSSDKKWALA
ncbi:ParA family protein [Vibrio sp. ZSDE26]|uniref:ParA family protein n=1 Tax=Vibrio amylolyticus TaxID=2847292 RepID=A0A9X2BJV4_9VIBR|nr:ParA family protein [Vibrio amylolyticus]MCK6262118.1 ParA family protein [Vibrio amylolyticus]